MVVQVGAGGAGSAVAHALLTLGADRLVVIDRDTARAERLAGRLQDRFGSERVRHVDRGRLDDAVATADGVVNTTPLGMAVFQAVDAFALITGRQPDTSAMFADFHELVALESLEGTA
jgi:shikimate 5-dehydrogenase